MLQDALVAKNGSPLVDGVVTCYQDNSRTTLKNWYYQSGTPGNYTYITLPNPLTLSAAGTICDINGVDTIPFFYPYDENDDAVSQPYYITVVDQFGTLQFTRANFPFVRTSTTPVIPQIETFNNLIINNGFWRNIQPNYINQTLVSVALNTYAVGGVVNVVVAPSQHDGLTMPDIRFLKNNTSATDTVTFTPFPASNSPVISLAGTPYTTPEYYINHQCTSVGSGETQKCYQFPIALHLNNLANLPFTVSIQAQWGGSGSQVIQLNLLQFTGTGTTSPAPIRIGGTSITLTTAWTNYNLIDVFPSIVGLPLGLGEDDAFYLQVQMPFNASCAINFTKPSLYLTTEALPVNDFQLYDQVAAITNSPRVGDTRSGYNSFYYFGWLPMNNGLIGLTNPGSSTAYVRANSDTWKLFNLLWTIGKTYDTGSNFNRLFPMYTNTAGTLALTNYGSTAYGDFTTSSPSRALSLPYQMGLVMMGTVPLAALLQANSTFTGYQVPVTASNGSPALTFNYTNTLNFGIFLGATISFQATGSLPDAIQANAIYYAIPSTGTAGQFTIATTFANAIAGTAIAYGTTSGSNIVAYLFQAASSTGEYGHMELLNEMKQHTHNTLLSNYSYLTESTSGSTGWPSGTSAHTSSLDSTTGNVTSLGTQQAFNVTQPGVFANIYIKL